MNRKEYERKLKQWEAEGYDVSELREKWFLDKKAKDRSHIGKWLAIVTAVFIIVAGIAVWMAVKPPPPPVGYILNVSVYPSGSGSVSPSSGTYDEGTQVTLRATSDSNEGATAPL